MPAGAHELNVITTDRIFMKILLEMYLWTKNWISSGSHPLDVGILKDFSTLPDGKGHRFFHILARISGKWIGSSVKNLSEMHLRKKKSISVKFWKSFESGLWIWKIRTWFTWHVARSECSCITWGFRSDRS